MDQTEVARYRALLRDQSQAKSGRLRPLSRWLGGDRRDGVEARRDEPASPLSPAPPASAPIASTPTLDGPPTFPPRRPLPPLDPALGGAPAAPVPTPMRTRAVRPAEPPAMVAPTAETPTSPQPGVELEPAPVIEAAVEAAVAAALEPPAQLTPELVDDFVAPPPLGILDLLSPEMIAEFDLERSATAAPRAFGRRDGDATVAEPDAVSSVAPISTPVLEAPLSTEPKPELLAEAETPPATDAAIELSTDETEDVAQATDPGTGVVEPDDVDDVQPSFGPLQPSPDGEETEALVSPLFGGDGREAGGGNLLVAGVAEVVPIAAAVRQRPPLVRRLEPERTPAAVMRNLQTILEAEQSIVELWRSIGRAAA